MSQVIHTSYCTEPGMYQAVRLPYQGTKRNAMLVIMPSEGQFQAVESTLSTDTYNSILQNMEKYEVTLSLPGFNYEWAASLKTPLLSLGMRDAFSDTAADFSGITGRRDLFISDVIQKSFVAVDEKGTEASAATAVIFSETSIPVFATMTIDRPFIYLIYNEDTGAILFCGRVLNPGQN